MTDDIYFECSQCGKLFEPDPRTMVEGFITAHEVVPEASEEWKCGVVCPHDLQRADREDVKREFGITDAQIEALLRGEAIPAGGLCICLECQDNAGDGT